jgi:hypothetical protein
MAQLIKTYPANPNKNRIVWSGDLETMKAHLNEIEMQKKSNQLSKCGTIFTELSRVDELTLNTCVFKNINTDNEETIDINYIIFP